MYLIICNCDGGICRSSAVAGALSKIIMNDDTKYFKRFYPNRYVYKSILNTFIENISDYDKLSNFEFGRRFK